MAGISTGNILEDNEAMIGVLKNSRLFNYLPDEKLKKLVFISELLQIPARAEILREGEANDKVYILLGGKLGVFAGGEPIIKLKRKGDIVGEMSVISNKPCSATVITESKVSTFKIQAKDIGNYTDLESDEVKNILYRAFAVSMADKLSFITRKDKKYMHEHRRFQRTQKKLQQTNEMLDNQAKKWLEAKKQAELANQAKSEFLSNISHELRNPMHHILSYSKFGIDKIDNPKEKLLHYFKQIRKSASRLMIFLNDLLDLSKIENGMVDYVMKKNDILQIIEEASNDLRQFQSEKGLCLELIKSEIPTSVFCDSFKIGQVIRNLFSNSIKFTPNGRKISISLNRASLKVDKKSTDRNTVAAILISVKDEGIGIPDDELNSIFDKFTQSSKTKTSVGGTGLGLAICKEIVKSHNGEIWAENNPEGGATLSFVLPYEQC